MFLFIYFILLKYILYPSNMWQSLDVHCRKWEGSQHWGWRHLSTPNITDLWRKKKQKMWSWILVFYFSASRKTLQMSLVWLPLSRFMNTRWVPWESVRCHIAEMISLIYAVRITCAWTVSVGFVALFLQSSLLAALRFVLWHVSPWIIGHIGLMLLCPCLF